MGFTTERHGYIPHWRVIKDAALSGEKALAGVIRATPSQRWRSITYSYSLIEPMASVIVDTQVEAAYFALTGMTFQEARTGHRW